MSDDRVAQVAVIAKEPVEYWMVTVRAEQSEGQAAKVWSSLARRLATSAAALFVLLAATTLPGIGARDAHAQDGAAFRVNQASSAYYVNTACIRLTKTSVQTVPIPSIDTKALSLDVYRPGAVPS
jgi:hypothetical protein